MRVAAAFVSISLIMLAAIPNADELKRMSVRFAPVPLRVDTSKLSKDDMRALPKLIEAARVVDHIFLQQLWSGNLKLYADLQKDASPLGKLRLQYFWLNKGPWSALDEHKAFLPNVPEKKPAGANFYPEDLTKTEFEVWVKSLPLPPSAKLPGFFP